MVTAVNKFLGKGHEISVEKLGPRPGAEVVIANPTLAHKELNWKALANLDEMVTDNLNWAKVSKQNKAN